MKARRGPDVRGGVRERSCQEAARGRERSGHPAEGQHSLAPTQRPRQVRGSPPLPTNFRAPPSHPHTCPELGHAPVAARRFNRFALRAHTQDKRVHHLGKPGRREQLSPRGSGACAVHRARLCVGKEHAQCEGTIGYVGAQGMLAPRQAPGPFPLTLGHHAAAAAAAVIPSILNLTSSHTRDEVIAGSARHVRGSVIGRWAPGGGAREVRGAKAREGGPDPS
ncbi:hypothetical protein TREES_T100017894 [Tupaia chinensis]|uniref:Uncharacterized protein n=1 Tax=Tupaia chinensis TaxID=246437 RepID=L9JRQ9_TUPCH|nr:hypothetical protein TREES_T100017894 [Tupaia chinensis]